MTSRAFNAMEASPSQTAPKRDGRRTLSVVLPNYNHSKHIGRVVESIMGQSRPPDEFLILDDASTDNSLEVIHKLAQQHSVIRVLQNETNLGVNKSNRKLFALASGDYIHPCAADDARLPGFFETAMGLAEQHPQAGLVFGQVVVRNEQQDPIGHVTVANWSSGSRYVNPQQFLDEYLESELASHSASAAVIYRSDAFDEVGQYRENLESWADTFAMRAIGLKYGVCYAPADFAVDLRLEGSYSQGVKDDPRRAIDIVARAASLMRSDEFRDLFPADHVRRWERSYRRLVAWQYFLGNANVNPRPSFLIRNLKRLPRALTALRLLMYNGHSS